MNKYVFDVMNDLIKKGYTNQRNIARDTGYSLGRVNESIKILLEEGYIREDFSFTDKAKMEIMVKKPRNAVILAAGYGVRMAPINNELPKGLLRVRGEALIERLIKQLHEVGVYEIDIVVGFLMERYEYLIDKYNVNLVYNPDFKLRNNLHSLNVVGDKIANTYIVPCDIWAEENPFSDYEFYSWYGVTDEKDIESCIRINRNREPVYVKAEEVGNKMVGIAYILEKETSRVRRKLHEFTNMKRRFKSLWEEILFDRNNKMTVYARVFSKDKIFDINTYEQLRDLDQNSSNLDSEIIDLIAEKMNVEVMDIENISVLKKGMTNRSFIFENKGKKYIMRVPGEGTDKLVNRRNEYNVYKTIKDGDISDKVVYISGDTGYKITEFIHDARSCNPKDETDVRRCMSHLQELHKKKFVVPHKFDLFERLEFYESLWGEEQSIFKDYNDTKSDILSLKLIIDASPKEWALTHIDAVADNFLLTDEEVHLIDWEYSSMQDPHVDIAMFAIYAMYNKEELDKLIDIYFDGRCPLPIREKIYCYVAVCGLLWSNWCEYKRHHGVDFGDYSLRQYRYAKEFFKIVMDIEKENRRVAI